MAVDGNAARGALDRLAAQRYPVQYLAASGDAGAMGALLAEVAASLCEGFLHRAVVDGNLEFSGVDHDGTIVYGWVNDEA